MNLLEALTVFIKNEIHDFKYEHKLKLISIIAIFVLFPISLLMAIVGFVVGLISEIREYNKSIYKLITKKSYFDVLFNKGLSAEYFTWKVLDGQPEYKKVLINLYIPKENNETAEIDAIMINKFGIFVFESKGYTGWIFGDENSKNWMEIIYGHKYKFYNPVMQNRNHIKALANIIGIEDMSIFRSYIVFSQKCDFKKIIVTKPNLKVVKQSELASTLNKEYMEKDKILTYEQIKEFDSKLSKYMFAEDEVKERHNKIIKEKYKSI